MENVYKLKVRVGEAEFEAEGPEDTVRDQFDLFMGCLADSGALRTGKLVKKPPQREDDTGGDPPDSSDDLDGEIDSTLLERAFRQDSKGSVSLRTLPNGESTTADALMLVLYGIQKIKGLHEVSAIELTASARQSGINLTRIDRTLATQSDYVRKGGAGKGMRYSLNNPGENKSAELLKSMYR
jgi:hypothetical protein